jgi:YD repeat-containing protein
MILDPTFRPKQGQKISDAVKDVFMTTEQIDDVVLDAALKKANLSPAEFAQATRTTVADAASIMQGYSALARTLKRVAELDPEAEKIIKDMYGKDQDVTSAMGYLMNGIRRLERESKALVVSSIATTTRNMMGTTMGMTWDAASRLLEGALYTTGKVLKGAATGTYERGDLTKGLQTTIRDAFGTLTYLTNALSSSYSLPCKRQAMPNYLLYLVWLTLLT